MATAQYGDSLDTSMPAGTPAPPAQPAALTLPAGIGNAQQANQASQFMRAQPWYQAFLKQNGQNPNNVHLTKDQSYQLLQLARQQGVGISTKYSLDSSGNIVSEGMPGWEKAAIIAGIVVGGYFLAPYVIAALGGEAAASGTAAAAAAGDTAAASSLAAAGGVEAGAVSGLGAAALPGAGTALGGAAFVPAATLASTTAGAGAAASDVGAGAASVAGEAAPLASTATVPTATGTIAGGTGLAAPLASATLPTATDTVAGGTGLTPAGTASDGSVISGLAGGGGYTTAASGSSLTDNLLRYGVPTAGSIISGVIQSNATTAASEAQQKYLEEALAYEKQRDAAAIALEGSRYADYSGNVAPYIARGNASGTRMSSLLGLPASSTTTAPTVSYGPSATSTGAGASISAPTASVTTGSPLPRATDAGQPVTMRAPDGSTKQVPPDQVAHFQSMGAQVVG